MKEYLRNIYRMADSAQTARTVFILWCEKADVSTIHCLKQMAKTIRKPFENESKGYLDFVNIIDPPMPVKKASTTRLDGSPDRHTDTGMKPTYIWKSTTYQTSLRVMIYKTHFREEPKNRAGNECFPAPREKPHSV